MLIKPPGRTVYGLFEISKKEQLFLELETSLKNGSKIRLLYDNLENKTPVLEFLENLNPNFPNLSIVEYSTMFYQNQLSKVTTQIKNYPQTDFGKYQEEYEILRINSINHPYYPVFEEMIISSNGIDFVQANGKTLIHKDTKRQKQILEGLQEGFSQSYNHGYLIKVKNQEIFAGCFMLIEFEKELMLHYVSGKSQAYQMILNKKMPYITSSILQIWQTEFAKFKFLTFSNKDQKTKAVYQGNGFLVNSNRYCYILKNNLQELDLK
jgi:hypothetical protein